jgi:hypothetical protein
MLLRKEVYYELGESKKYTHYYFSDIKQYFRVYELSETGSCIYPYERTRKQYQEITI